MSDKTPEEEASDLRKAALRAARWARTDEVELARLEAQAVELARHPETLAAIERQREAITRWHEGVDQRLERDTQFRREENEKLFGLIREQNAALARIVALMERKA